ncbi:MAG: hypothetical protein IJQ96_08925 [Bacteroidales bacterium]|nr:hypothetical protein [Bacteroidales bacterium]
MSFLDITPEDIDLQEPVFIEFDGLPVPFFFESFTPKGNNRAIVQLTGVRNLKDADELSGADVYADYFEEDQEEDFTGWTVRDQDGREVGSVSAFEDIPGNTCLWVQRADGQEILLPLHQDLVLGVDENKHILTLTIPDGILDL